MDKLVSVLSEIGAPIISSILRDVDVGNPIANIILRKLGETVIPGKEPSADEIAEHLVTNSVAEKAVIELEKERGPEWAEIYRAGLLGQFQMLRREDDKGGWQAAWRPGWMYLLAAFWILSLVVIPIVNAIASAQIDAPPPEILLTLTSWFIGLYMGGHTLKELGKNAIDAVREWKGRD